MRLFLALPLPADARGRLAAFQQALRRLVPEARWVRPQDMHLTLRFYGEVDPGRLEPLAAALQEALAPVRPLALVLDGLGAFPHPARARVLWAGVAGELEALAALQARAEEASRRAGLGRDPRAFHPHVTLARLPRPQPLPEAAGPERHVWQADRAVLYESRLTPGGPLYRALATFDLAAGP